MLEIFENEYLIKAFEKVAFRYKMQNKEVKLDLFRGSKEQTILNFNPPYNKNKTISQLM